MKNYAFIIFFSIFLSLYSLINYYIYSKGNQALSTQPTSRIVYTVVFIFLAASYMLSRFIEKTDLYGLHHVLYWTGSLWFAAMEYFLIASLFVDLIRLLNLPIGFLPEKTTLLYANIKLISFGVTTLIVIAVLIYGLFNARRPVVTEFEINIDKKGGKFKEINLVMVSDIHLGTLLGRNRVLDMVQRINSLHPDLVIFAGDILDEVQRPIFRNDTGDPLRLVKAPLGVFGITGNHEYIGDAAKAVAYIESKGVKMLRDTVVIIDESIALAGREDRDSKNFGSYKRKTVHELLSAIDRSMPLFLLDHQPLQLQQAVDAGADLQLSGHTHHGQFWPNNIFTVWIFEISKGYKLKGNTHFIVSSGYGYWGPPVRIGTRPEIVKIKVNFQHQGM